MSVPTVNYVQGRNLVIYVNNKPVGCSKTCTIEITTSLNNSTTKCDVDPVTNSLWAHNSPEENSWKITDAGSVPIQNSAGALPEYDGRALAILQANQTIIYVQFQNSLTGLWMGGNGFITSTKLTGETMADATYDVTIEGTGQLNFLPVS